MAARAVQGLGAGLGAAIVSPGDLSITTTTGRHRRAGHGKQVSPHQHRCFARRWWVVELVRVLVQCPEAEKCM
jgi:hypothetical protein